MSYRLFYLFDDYHIRDFGINENTNSLLLESATFDYDQKEHTIEISGNVVKVLYVKDEFDYIVEYYQDTLSNKIATSKSFEEIWQITRKEISHTTQK